MYSDNKTVIRLNAMKHHAGFIMAKIKEWKNAQGEDVEDFLLSLGNNQFDLYTGELEVSDICREINQYMQKEGIDTKQKLKNWLGRQEYRTLYLSDDSRWIIRESASGEDFAHTHPARNQSLVSRIKARHLKTAIILLLNGINKTEIHLLTTEQINLIRVSRFGLSPVKSLHESCNIIHTLAFLLNL